MICIEKIREILISHNYIFLHEVQRLFSIFGSLIKTKTEIETQNKITEKLNDVLKQEIRNIFVGSAESILHIKDNLSIILKGNKDSLQSENYKSMIELITSEINRS